MIVAERVCPDCQGKASECSLCSGSGRVVCSPLPRGMYVSGACDCPHCGKLRWAWPTCEHCGRGGLVSLEAVA